MQLLEKFAVNLLLRKCCCFKSYFGKSTYSSLYGHVHFPECSCRSLANNGVRWHPHSYNPACQALIGQPVLISDQRWWRWLGALEPVYTLLWCRLIKMADMSLKQMVWLPESWLAILRRVSPGEILLSVRADEDAGPPLFPSGFLMVKLSAYFSRGSSRESTRPSSHNL